MIVTGADIDSTVFGFLEAVRKKLDLVLERVLTEVVRLTTADVNEGSFAALHKRADRFNQPECVRASPLL
jgi:hypothetical protein